jgi:hypothetical protein
MGITVTNKNFKNKGKDIKYLDKDFIGVKAGDINNSASVNE